ncbi:cupin domain-containing protein [Virgibacillus sp. CBA3643]|uniref:cupin domain-containing protein n=1 Tax=Virgibacillus sp. CBA3643 TaxID=2942278 RepID=UPI0035A2F98D
MKINKQGFDKNGLLTLFENKSDDLDVKFGTVTIQPGDRVPKEGLSTHKETEYSFIIKGELEGESGGEPYKVSTSDATLFPAGEEHWAINASNRPCQIVWMLVKGN